MDKKALSDQLHELARSANRSKAAQLRDVIDEIEVALAAGVPRSAVLHVLSAHGLQMTMATFETTLRRNRAARARNPAPLAVSSVGKGMAANIEHPPQTAQALPRTGSIAPQSPMKATPTQTVD